MHRDASLDSWQRRQLPNGGAVAAQWQRWLTPVAEIRFVFAWDGAPADASIAWQARRSVACRGKHTAPQAERQELRRWLADLASE